MSVIPRHTGIIKLLYLLLSIGYSHSYARDVNAVRLVVDINGKGDFRSVQAAINSLSESSSVPRTIFIRKGVYHEKIFIAKSNIIIEGEDKDQTIITAAIARDEWRCSNSDDRGAATMNVDGNDITLVNLTIINSYGFDNNADRTIECPADSLKHTKVITKNGHQMALRTINATRLKAINVHFKAYAGDTVSPWNVEEGMFYFKNCQMEGGVDFYCPRGWAYAEGCKFYANTGAATIWHDGSKNQDSKTVLKDCYFDGFKGFNLGRYHRDAQFYLINCHFSENMADKDIYLVPTTNTIQWGRRVYYYNCHKEGGDYAWHKDNLSTAVGAPAVTDITPSWVFRNNWDVTLTAKSKGITVTLINPSSVVREDELVTLSRAEIEKVAGPLRNEDHFLVEGKQIPVQQDDLNGDGKWDEAVFLYSLQPKEKATVTLIIGSSVKAPTVRAFAGLAKKQEHGYSPLLQSEVMPVNAEANNFSQNPIPNYRVEGPVWENDKVAFRIYFDKRNAKDIFGKTTSAIVMDTVGNSGDKYYHTFDSRWGMDILKVGNSLGAGGLALATKGDSLVRLAGNTIGKASYHLVSNGPVRSIVRMEYNNWKVNNTTYNVSEEISIWGGQYFYQDKVTLDKLASLSTGVVNLHAPQQSVVNKNGCNILATWDKQSDNGDELGLAIMSPSSQVKKNGITASSGTGITNSYTTIFRESNNITYRFYSCWEKTSGRVADRQHFDDFLLAEAKKWNEPIKINISNY